MLRGEDAVARPTPPWLALIAVAALIASSMASGACVPRPSEPRCRAMADHMIELEPLRHEGRAAELAAEVANDRREALVSTCLSEGTVAEVECVLELDTLDQLPRCAPR